MGGVRDLHLKRLHYRFVTPEPLRFSVSFEGARPVEFDTPQFSITLRNGQLTASTLEHFATESSAQAALEQVLEAWTVKHALWAGRREFQFEFERAEVVDRDPPPPLVPGEPQVVAGAAAVSARATASASAHVPRACHLIGRDSAGPSTTDQPTTACSRSLVSQ